MNIADSSGPYALVTSILDASHSASAVSQIAAPHRSANSSSHPIPRAALTSLSPRRFERPASGSRASCTKPSHCSGDRTAAGFAIAQDDDLRSVGPEHCSDILLLAPTPQLRPLFFLYLCEHPRIRCLLHLEFNSILSSVKPFILCESPLHRVSTRRDISQTNAFRRVKIDLLPFRR